MRDFIILFVHVIVTMVRLAGPGGLRSVVAESASLRHQLLILSMANYKTGLNTVICEVLQRLLTWASSHVNSCCNGRFVIVFVANL